MCGEVNAHQSASVALSDFIGTQTVSCTMTNEPDDHGRRIAQCRVGGSDLGRYMVSRGWARDWPRYSEGAYADEEASARAANRGIWGLRCPVDLWPASRD
jgi:endonuclease YncB( thermonuclease family)